MPVVTFDITEFKAWFPTFTAEAAPFLSGCFDRACGFLANSDGSCVADVTERKGLLYLATAHIALLEKGGPQNVGQITNASQGSVSVGRAVLSQPGKQSWWQQTQYGAEFWQKTVMYRSFTYVPS